MLAEQRETVLMLTLNRPEPMNAWTDALEDRYFERLAAAEADRAVRAIVVTGAGRGLCAGADPDDLAAAGLGLGVTSYRERRAPSFPPLSSHVLPTCNSCASGVS